MKLKVTELPAGGSVIEFETNQEIYSEESMIQRRVFESKVPLYMSKIMSGMESYKKNLADRGKHGIKVEGRLPE